MCQAVHLVLRGQRDSHRKMAIGAATSATFALCCGAFGAIAFASLSTPSSRLLTCQLAVFSICCVLQRESGNSGPQCLRPSAGALCARRLRTRQQFRDWATPLAARFGYGVRFADIGHADEERGALVELGHRSEVGGGSQAAVFTLLLPVRCRRPHALQRLAPHGGVKALQRRLALLRTASFTAGSSIALSVCLSVCLSAHRAAGRKSHVAGRRRWRRVWLPDLQGEVVDQAQAAVHARGANASEPDHVSECATAMAVCSDPAVSEAGGAGAEALAFGGAQAGAAKRSFSDSCGPWRTVGEAEPLSGAGGAAMSVDGSERPGKRASGAATAAVAGPLSATAGDSGSVEGCCLGRAI
jgi:hypothetical protein